MSKLFVKQAKQYFDSRPNYPDELFQFIASKTPCHDLAWDVGTGSGQAATSLSTIYKNVIATDTSQKQLDLAPKLSNVQYKCTPPNMSIQELEQNIIQKSTIDLITIAQAIHWFDLPTFYQQVKHVLRKPNGVIAAWCYKNPKVNPSVDLIFQRFYRVDSDPYWASERKLVDGGYVGIEFPFEGVDGCDGNGPFEFEGKKLMDLEGYFTYIRSWSAYQSAKEKGVELLSDDVVEEFRCAWNEDGQSEKVLSYPIYLRIGKVGNLD